MKARAICESHLDGLETIAGYPSPKKRQRAHGGARPLDSSGAASAGRKMALHHRKFRGSFVGDFAVRNAST